MNQPTDTIPEAREVLALFNRSVFKEEDFAEAITQACIAYHKRKLAECGGGSISITPSFRGEVIIWLGASQLISGVAESDVKRVTELLQLHTAKAVEEATRLLKEQIRVADVAFQGLHERHQSLQGHHDYCRSLLNCPEDDVLGESIATLQKQCSNLQTMHRHVSNQRDRLEKQCEELRRQVAQRTAELNLIRKYPTNLNDGLPEIVDFVRMEEIEKERDDLRTKVQDQRAQLERITKDWTTDMPVTITNDEATQELIKDLRTRAEKAERQLETFLAKHPECKQ